ncbi:hypothetical protein LOC71_23770 [Rhodopirellula sp. JC740]|uniref:Uncharacterized protein n=1 Tax=Rhodopirellula halodulae TaxID=2894198 RepID=A0ABS8NPJ0_9BACT|nr:hypothetical protein [Rhodopirellula sp. JC740]MCC9645309.1 hypothetical protein [Rhodopirellula sp. JC740]
MSHSPTHRPPLAKADAETRSKVPFWGKLLLGVLSLALVVGGGVSSWAWHKSRQVPDFYQRALDQSDQAMQVARNQWQHDVEQLQSDLSRRGSWNASFNEEEINAWLSDQLPERFDRLLRRGVREPAIAIEDGQILAAVRYKSSRWDTVVSCRLSVQMTEEPNLLAIHLSDLKAGALPLPLEPFVRRISKEAALGDLDIRWDFTDDGPIALVHIPPEDPHYAFQPLVIELVSLTAGRLRLAGHAGQLAQNHYAPRGPVHRFVSFQRQSETDDVNSDVPSQHPATSRARSQSESNDAAGESSRTSLRGRRADAQSHGTKSTPDSSAGNRWIVRKPSHATPAVYREVSEDAFADFQ